jgi:thiamine biosynthesis lipoprotein
VRDFASIGRRLARVLPTALLFAVAGCASPPASAPALRRFEFEQPQMGVPFRMVLYASSLAEAEAAATAAFQRVRQLNELLSDYEDESELTRLSRTAGRGKAVPVSPELWFVLAHAQALAERSGGAFDVTVGPCVQLWRRARRVKQLPRDDALAAARAAVGWQKLRLDPRRRTAELLAPRMRLDLGGIAKGYAVDEALKVLRARGITRALVSGGGDLAVGEPPPGQRGWRVELAPLDVTNAPPALFVRLANQALAMSGDVFQHLEIAGRRYSHIVDPRTGVGLTDHSLVTVLARDGTTADSLATAVSVLGPDAGLRLIERTAGAAARIVRRPADTMEVFESTRFRQFVETPPPPETN